MIQHDDTAPDLQGPVDRPVRPGAAMRFARMLRLYVAATDGVTQKQIARESGVNVSTLSRFINGDQMPDGRSFAALLAWALADDSRA